MNLAPQPTLVSETREWLVLAKPSGWLSIPAPRMAARMGGRAPETGPMPVLLDWVRASHPEALTVHRLDVETSGIILFARGPEAHRRVNMWFQNREVRKQYVCLASGKAARPILKIQKLIEGAACSTQVEVLKQFKGAFHGRVRPLTGKRHQIRIHLASEGNALLGDSRYGGPRSLEIGAGRIEIGRVALHSELLELPSGERFSAPVPADFAGWLSALEGEKGGMAP